MVDFNSLAIADVLRHPELGLVSYQPRLHDHIQDKIPVRDIKFEIHSILASECEDPTEEEVKYYWNTVPRGRKLSKKDIAKLEKDFTHHPPKDNQLERYEEIREAAKGMAALIMFICPESRERSLAIGKLEECVFWSEVSIARNQ